jgi:adenosylcobinamide kinase/adenosylcobinamide-phosphate guanylyltransferase
MAVLVTGGARSGKSRFAERYAATLGTRGLYIATMQGLDDEMRDRIELHRLRREQSGFSWRTVEEPLELAELLRQHAELGEERSGEVILVDCLTLWLSNWLLELEGVPDADDVLERNIDELAEALASVRKPVIAVTNEVGDGVVPEYPLGRRFRDFAGVMNQRVAEVCEEVFLVTTGIPVELKKIAFTFGNGEGSR